MSAIMSLDDRVMHLVSVLGDNGGVTRCGTILQRPLIFGNVPDIADKAVEVCLDCFQR